MLLQAAMMLQRALPVPPPEPTPWWRAVIEFLDTPAPYSPFSEYLLVLFLLWLLARREEAARRREPFSVKAQEVLDEKYQSGELSKEAYDRFRQEVTMRPPG